MRQVKIIIERTKNHYSAYAENVPGVYGGGETPQEAKTSIIDSIRLLKKYNQAKNIPAILKGDYEIIYRYDIISLLNYYKTIVTHAALEKMTGIHQKQIQHYASGLRKPREKQSKKIENAFHQLGQELLAVELG
jgi:predicted RNase H-like HicB family nuclease